MASPVPSGEISMPPRTPSAMREPASQVGVENASNTRT